MQDDKKWEIILSVEATDHSAHALHQHLIREYHGKTLNAGKVVDVQLLELCHMEESEPVESPLNGETE